ncbi:MAG: FtsX-like permease family protein [Pyrinomonadaceae bacterium]
MKFSKLVLRNILRNKLRTLLTISSIVVSLFLIITLATVLHELTRGSSESNPLRLVSRHAVSLGFVIPMAHQQKIAQIPGVKAVMPFSWFGGIYKDESNFFANFAVDAKQLRNVMTELKMPEDQWQAFIDDRQGAVVGRKLANQYHFEIGQRITLQSPIYDRSVEFVIRGICTGLDEKTLFFHHEYVNELVPTWAKDQVSTFSILANTSDDVPRISQAADQIFLNTDAPTKTESEAEFARSFETMYGGIKQFMYGIMAAIAFSLLLVMANNMSMNVRERTREVGTLKALGFRRGTIAGLLVSEALVVTVIGAAIGIGGAYLLFRSRDFSASMPFFQSFLPTWQILVTVFVVAVLVGTASVIYSAYRVSGMTIAEALRSNE